MNSERHQWEIIYRVLPCKPYGTPWKTAASLFGTWQQAIDHMKALEKDFPSAEWSIIQCTNTR